VDKGPAFFNDDGLWRFDPPLTHRGRYGVCYLGTEPLASYVEVFGRTLTIPRTEIFRRLLSEMTIPTAVDLADLTNRKALGFGVDAGHSTSLDYGHAQQLSGVLYEAGFQGIYYRVRHDPDVALEAVALFGSPGERPEHFDSPKTSAISDDLIDAADKTFGLTVLPGLL
jgi:hypothetical protein